jgi:exosome complex component RRP40
MLPTASVAAAQQNMMIKYDTRAPPSAASLQNLTVDIGAPTLAVLPQLSFEGATKRNRPAVKAGDLVYARVVSASRDTDPILSCVDAFGRASGFGALKEGLPLQVSTALARQLLAQPPAPVLQQLGQLVQFELAVGMNGRVWVCAPEELWKSSFVAQAITQSEYLNAAQVHVLVHQMWERVKDKAETKAMET